MPGAVEKYADVARALGLDGAGLSEEELAYAGVEQMQKLADALEIPHFSELDMVKPKDFPRLAKTAANASETQDNPVIMEEQDFIQLFTELYENGTIEMRGKYE